MKIEQVIEKIKSYRKVRFTDELCDAILAAIYRGDLATEEIAVGSGSCYDGRYPIDYSEEIRLYPMADLVSGSWLTQDLKIACPQVAAPMDDRLCSTAH